MKSTSNRFCLPNGELITTTADGESRPSNARRSAGVAVRSGAEKQLRLQEGERAQVRGSSEPKTRLQATNDPDGPDHDRCAGDQRQHQISAQQRARHFVSSPARPPTRQQSKDDRARQATKQSKTFSAVRIFSNSGRFSPVSLRRAGACAHRAHGNPRAVSAHGRSGEPNSIVNFYCSCLVHPMTDHRAE